MKNIISAAVIATVATVGTMASADITTKGLVFRDGVAIGSMYDVKIMDGKTDAEARSEIKAHYVKAKADAKRERDQEVKAKIAFAKNNISIPTDLKDDALDYVATFVEDNRDELQAAADAAEVNLDDVVELVNELIENGAVSRELYNENAATFGVTETFEEAQAIVADYFDDVRDALAAKEAEDK